MKRGKFFAVEGIDGSGSTTQAKRLCSYLQSLGRQVHYTTEPSSGPLGVVIRQFLKGEFSAPKMLPPILALAFAADRLHHDENEILPKLAQGIDVVSDRYVMSSLVYQGLDLPNQWVASVNEYATTPDITILIDAPANIAETRRTMRGGTKEIFDENTLQTRIRERYLKFAVAQNAIIIDGSADVDVVERRMIEAVREKVS